MHIQYVHCVEPICSGRSTKSREFSDFSALGFDRLFFMRFLKISNNRHVLAHPTNEKQKGPRLE